MNPRDLHDGRADGLVPLVSLDLGEIDSFSGLVRAMSKTAFGGRQLGNAMDIFLEMARDPDCKVIMTLSGAMTVAKQGTIICDMIERGLVDCVVATGALMAHGLTESIGLAHYATSPDADDTELFEKGYNRIYDTLEMESNLNDVEVIVRSAFRHKVPVFIPAFTDSEMGLDVATWAMSKVVQPTGPDVERDSQEVFQTVPNFNPFYDLQEYARFIGRAKKVGIFTIGGGVPRNWAQQVAPYYDITAHRLDIKLHPPRFNYGIRICPEPVHWGGLSGCTYSEGVSWGKFVPPAEGGRYAEVYADATVVWPLLMKAVFEELDRDKAAR